MLAIIPICAQQSANPPEVQAQPGEGNNVNPPFQIHAERNLVTVMVVVRDSNGHPVGGLHKEDFQLFDDGKAQEISGFSAEITTPEAQRAQRLGAPTAPANAPSVPAASTVPERFIILFFDDFHTEIEGIARTREAAWQYAETRVGPADRVAIHTATGKDQLDFTGDQAKLHEALFRTLARPHPPGGCPQIDEYEAYLAYKLNDPDALRVLHTEGIECLCGVDTAGSGRPGSIDLSLPATINPSRASGRGRTDPNAACVWDAERQSESVAAEVWSHAEMESEYALQAIDQSVRRLAAMPGQRSLVLVSPGFLTETQGEKVDAITDLALEQKVVISAIDAAGLDARVSKELTKNVAHAGLGVTKDRLKNTGAVAMSGVLAYLSGDTGGVYFHNSNDFAEGFREAAAVPEFYYVLTFTPAALKLNGEFHSLKVKVNRHEPLTVQARRGYIASRATLAGQPSGPGELDKILFSQGEIHGLPAEVTAQAEKVNAGERMITVNIHVDVGQIPFRKEHGRSTDRLVFHTSLFDIDGAYVTGKEASLDLRLNDKTLAKVSHSGINARTSFIVAPGSYRVREVVQDTDSKTMSALDCNVQAP